MDETTTDSKVWHPVPQPTEEVHSGDLLGVYLYPDEEVEWIWTLGLERNRVTGYTIKKKREIASET